jgi:hypothetical protein
MPFMPPLFERRPRRYRQHLFDDLPLELRWKAEGWLSHLCQKWRGNLPGWRMAILIGRARWLALNPPDSAWGRRMLARRGGLATQERYRREGRIGTRHPAHKAAQISARNRRWRKQKEQEEQQRKALGLPPMTRHKVLPCW